MTAGKEDSMNQLAGTHHRHRYAPRAWAPQIRIAAVAVACLIVEAVVATNVMDVTVNIVAFLAPLWVFAVAQAWPTKDKLFEIATMLLAVAATAGVLVFYAL
jgi:hypothetical protein